MSGVVIRCLNCGTTQSALGECDACHEAETRYFCPNHTPGRWLDAPSCSACGARVGHPGRTERPAAPPPRATPTPPPRTRAATPPPARRAPPREVIYPPDELDRMERTERTGRTERTEPRERTERTEPDVWSGPVFPPREAGVEGFGSAGSRPAWPGAASIVPTALKIFSLLGCLRRLIMLAIVLGILALLAFYALFGVGGFFSGTITNVQPPTYAVATSPAPSDAPTRPTGSD